MPRSILGVGVSLLIGSVSLLRANAEVNDLKPRTIQRRLLKPDALRPDVFPVVVDLLH
jgi:hypothetical protein